PNFQSSRRCDAEADGRFGFVGSRDRNSGMIHLPPARVSEKGGAVDDMEPVPMADTLGTVVSFTIDKLVYSPSPPVVFAVVDFDGGGRAPLELADCGPDEIEVGLRVRPTFRRLFTADEIHNYFWKVAPVRDVASGEEVG
ncbi:MAG: OB-fold domain-containing protein, partial [Actinomycetota bacterium]